MNHGGEVELLVASVITINIGIILVATLQYFWAADLSWEDYDHFDSVPLRR
jgi:hypothetical protein